jgi:hypothetical protein
MRLLRFALLILAIQLSAAGCQKAEPIASSVGASCFEPASAAAPDAHYLDRRISVSYAGLSMGEVVRSLHNMYALPISYIEVVPAKAVDRKVDGLTVRSLLRDLVNTRQGYVCRVVEGHVVLYPDLPDLDKAVRGVDIVGRFRGAAARSYVEYARNQVPFFRDVDVVLGGLMDSPLFDERVSLDPEARAIGHLSQLLGRDRRAFFVIQRSPAGGLTLGLGMVSDRAMRLAHPRRPPELTQVGRIGAYESALREIGSKAYGGPT